MPEKLDLTISAAECDTTFVLSKRRQMQHEAKEIYMRQTIRTCAMQKAPLRLGSIRK